MADPIPSDKRAEELAAAFKQPGSAEEIEQVKVDPIPPPYDIGVLLNQLMGHINELTDKMYRWQAEVTKYITLLNEVVEILTNVQGYKDLVPADSHHPGYGDDKMEKYRDEYNARLNRLQENIRSRVTLTRGYIQQEQAKMEDNTKKIQTFQEMAHEFLRMWHNTIVAPFKRA